MPLKELLLEMKREAERVCADGGNRLPDDQLASLTESFERLIGEGLKARPRRDMPEGSARAILLRYEKYFEISRDSTNLSVMRLSRIGYRRISPAPPRPSYPTV